MSDEIARGGGVSAGIDDLVLAIKLGSGFGLVQEILARRAAADRARREGLTATEEEIAEALDDLYTGNDLFEEPQREAWRSGANLTSEVLHAHFAEVVLASKLREHLISDETIDAHFKASRHEYSRADVEIVEFESMGAAAETSLQLREGEIAWPEAGARAGGVDSQSLSRREAPEEIAAELFAAEAGSFLGPVETDEGGYAVYRLATKQEAELDDDLREQIRERMFSEEMARDFAKQPVRIVR
ncbi:MAG TPA: peptidylprolyl isomerase [Planctomycetota bacterium]|nr:peptidylprolyl isomerase [Planctomycetota bacterium]